MSWAMHIDPVEPSTLYVTNGYGKAGIFKSTDSGATWSQTFTPEVFDYFGPSSSRGFVGTMAIDPTDHDHLVAAPHFECGDGQGCLVETRDGGSTWTILRDAPGSSHDSGIRILGRDAMVLVDVWSGPDHPSHRSPDSGRTWRPMAEGISHRTLVRRADGVLLGAGFYGFQSSSDGGATWNAVDGGQRATSAGLDGETLFGVDDRDGYAWVAPASNPSAFRAIDGVPPAWMTDVDAEHQLAFVATKASTLVRVSLR
jgi:photosystem II stability/assembly factor-like uncharacterized protein